MTTTNSSRQPLILRQIKPPAANSTVSPDPVPTWVDIYFTAFTDDALSRRGFPRTPVVSAWFENMVREEIRDPTAVHFEVFDDAGPEEKVVAFAKWNRPKKSNTAQSTSTADEQKVQLPEWPKDESVDAALLNDFFGGLAEKKNAIMSAVDTAGNGYYYLEMVGTLPEYQGRGAASLVLQWGCDAADREGVPCYVEASPVGVPLYRKFGFVDRDKVAVDIRGFGEYENLCMVRLPRT